MEKTILIKYLEKLQINPNLNNFLNFFSVSIWDRIKFTRKHNGLKIYETTITQNFLYQIKLSIPSNESCFHMFESKNEKTNGNDLEIFIETSKGYIFFPTQAKII
jgi:hypothetical protein